MARRCPRPSDRQLHTLLAGFGECVIPSALLAHEGRARHGVGREISIHCYRIYFRPWLGYAIRRPSLVLCAMTERSDREFEVTDRPLAPRREQRTRPDRVDVRPFADDSRAGVVRIARLGALSSGRRACRRSEYDRSRNDDGCHEPQSDQLRAEFRSPRSTAYRRCFIHGLPHSRWARRSCPAPETGAPVHRPYGRDQKPWGDFR